MAELVITYISIIAIIDATINATERIATIIQSYYHKEKEITELKVKLDLTNETMKILKNYLGKVSLDQTVNELLKTNTKVVEDLVKDSELLIKKDKRLLFAVVDKKTLVALSGKLNESCTLISNYVQALEAINSLKNAKTLEDIRNVILEIRGDKRLDRLVDEVPRSIEKLSEQMKVLIEVVKAKDRTNDEIEKDSDSEIKIRIDETKLKNERSKKSKSIEWWHDKFERDGVEKDVLVEKISSKKSRIDVLKLALVLHQLGSTQNILKFEGIFENPPGQFFFVSCRTGKENLKEFIGSDTEAPSPSDRIKIAHGVACAFAFLHEAGVYHRNLRSHNVYIDTETMTPYLSGFSNARRVSDTSISNTTNAKHDKYLWDAPERAGDIVAEFSSKCEAYTFGVLLLVIGYWNTWSTFEEVNWEYLKVGDNPSKWKLDDYLKIKQAVVTDSKVFDGTQYKVYEELLQECMKGRAKTMGEEKSGTSGSSQEPASLYGPYAELIERCFKLDAHERPTFREIRTELGKFLDELEELKPK